MLHVIGDEKPRGICGSGIVELLAGMFLNGWVDALGNLNPDASSRIIRAEKSPGRGAGGGCRLLCMGSGVQTAGGSGIYPDRYSWNPSARKQRPIRWSRIWSARLGWDPDDIAHFYLAGAFGKYLDLESAITIGMYPDLPREKFVMLGNSSLDGAQKLLLDRHLVMRATELVKKITYVQFGNADFVEKMHAAQFLPYTDLDEYPSVKAKLARG